MQELKEGGGGASAEQESWDGEGVGFRESEVELGKMDHSGEVKGGIPVSARSAVW